MIVVFLAPALMLYSTFVLYPIIQSTRYSLYDWNGLESLDNFVGLDNFRRAFSDANFTAALKHNVIIIVLSLALQIPFALGLAMLLNSRIKGRAVLRTLFFAPYVLSEVVTGVVWRQILASERSARRDDDIGGPWRADAGLALRSRRRAVRVVLRHLVEVLRVPHGDPARRSPTDPEGAR